MASKTIHVSLWEHDTSLTHTVLTRQTVATFHARPLQVGNTNQITYFHVVYLLTNGSNTLGATTGKVFKLVP